MPLSIKALPPHLPPLMEAREAAQGRVHGNAQALPLSRSPMPGHSLFTTRPVELHHVHRPALSTRLRSQDRAQRSH